VNNRQNLAFSGDISAAKHILLPCYRPIFRCFTWVYVIFAVLLSILLICKPVGGLVEHYCLQYFYFAILTIYFIAPVLLLQRSVSKLGFWITFFTLFPWWLVCSLLWFLSLSQGTPQPILEGYFIVCSAAVPSMVSICVLTKLLSSRVQVGSCSNRNSMEFLLIYASIFGLLYLLDLVCGSTDSLKVEILMAVFSFFSNQLFPYALYRTLLADTKFWRGMGKHNSGGIFVNDSLRDSGVDIHRPTMELNTVSSSFQEMMTDINEISIDFAYLQLEQVIGQGASSKVFSGKFKQKLVAIKLSTPPEVTQEVIDVFIAEAKIASTLIHINIVSFIGICVRPPQIAMVFEFCEGGNLKTSLQKNPDRWTSTMRIKACLDSANAVDCLHSMGFIHRDLKAENFFVGNKNVVKLGDFGESTRVRNKESTDMKRMSILGTVSFMAPELIAASKHYTQSIDIFALAVTMWEIWTGSDPYESKSQFEIYEAVSEGIRPHLSENAPDGFNEILNEAWQQNSVDRPTSRSIATLLENILSVIDDQHVFVMDSKTMNKCTDVSSPLHRMMTTTVLDRSQKKL
jgi:tRNA A-37 threonylcarbamoyl transferase component Bud32